MNKHSVILAGTKYVAELIDNQVVFASNECGIIQNFTFERPPIKDKPGIWQLYSINLEEITVPICHITAALQWANATFGADFLPYKGGIKYCGSASKKAAISRPSASRKFGANGCGDL